MAASSQSIDRLRPSAPSQATPSRPRLESIDLLRGLIMVLMALDHTRDFFSNANFDPLDLEKTNAFLFMTRWLTHYCAPNFILLAGVGAFLTGSRGKSKSELSRFLFSRGLWLVFLEITVVRCLGWAFNFNFNETALAILWAIGWSMVVLSGLIFLPSGGIAAFGIILILFHNALDGIAPSQFGRWAGIWNLLHVPGVLPPVAGRTFIIGYPLIPWVGVMAAGYALGPVFTWNQEKRRRWLFRLGAFSTILFLAVRAVNSYGNARPWSHQNSPLLTAFSFIDCVKYPPSLDYLLMTIGPALIALSFFDRGTPTFLRRFLVFGRVPLFYYLLHLPLIHAMAVLVAWVRHGDARWLFHSPFGPGAEPPPNAGFNLAGVYLFWICTVVILYPLCCWFSELKRRRQDWWLSYL